MKYLNFLRQQYYKHISIGVTFLMNLINMFACLICFILIYENTELFLTKWFYAISYIFIHIIIGWFLIIHILGFIVRNKLN